MRRLILFAILFSALAAKGQTFLSPGFGYTQPLILGNHPGVFDAASNKKWFLSSYAGVSTGFGFFNGYNSSFLAVPLTLQLNRRLTNNVYAFGGVTAAPAYVNFNRSFLSSDRNKFYPNSAFSQPGSLGGYVSAELGLMYVNDARTFSISGSFSVERGSGFSAFPSQQTGSAKRSSFVPVK